MGYNTHYTLTQERNPIDEERLAGEIASLEEMAYFLNSDGTTRNRGKWYEHDENMISLSKCYPEALFKLHGEGQEAGDVWDKYYVGGELKHEVKLVRELPIPDFDKLVPDLKREKRIFSIGLTFPVFAYEGAEAREKLMSALSSSGIVFDQGNYSIKPSSK